MNIFRLAAFALVFGATGLLHAETIISSVPYQITTSGAYRLGSNLIGNDPNQTLILVSAANVTLDLGGFFLSGPAGATGFSSTAILVNNSSASNFVVRNGTVANVGYGVGIFGGFGSINHLVENVNFTRCYLRGIFFGASAAGSVVRNCTSSQIGGYTGSTSDGAAINTMGGVRIENNSISGVTSTGGLSSYGIKAGGDFCIGNTISNCSVGIFFGRCLNNLTSGCASPFDNCFLANGNL